MAGPVRYEHSGDAVATTLASDITSGATSLSLTASTGWPTGGTGPFWVKIDAGLAGEETVIATSRSGTSLSGLTRGSDGTAASAHSAGATVEHVFSAQEADDANKTAFQTLGTVTAKGDLLSATAANTLGKTAVGSDGQVVQALASAAGGITWASRSDGTDGYLHTGPRIDNAGTIARANTTYTDRGLSVSVTVPTWATRAIVHTHVRNLFQASGGVIGYVFRTVLGAVNGQDYTYGPTGTLTENQQYQIDYIDLFTGLSAGAVTLKTQVKGDGGGGGNSLSYSAGPASVDALVEFRP